MSATVYYSYLDSPIGRLLIRGDGECVTGLFMPSHKRGPEVDPAWRAADEPFAVARRELAEYFAGERTTFAAPIKQQGTPFQQQVWQELTRIPFGETITYAQLAQRVGKPTASRAVGAANGRNPISIIVPCHRVIGADGKLTGYAGGVSNKEWLLAWERRANGKAPRDLFGALEESPNDASVR